MNVNPYPIYVISLKRTPERRLYVRRQLDALNLDYQFVDAIDKYDLKSPECQAEICALLGIDKTALKERFNKHLGSSQFACSLSHIKAHKLMVKHNHSAACILEDDARISPDLPKILSAIQKKSWDILMLSSQSLIIRAIISSNLNIQKSVIESKKIDYSLFPKLRTVRWFRKLLPPTPTSSSELDWTLIPKLQWWLLMFFSNPITYSPIIYRFLGRFNIKYFRYLERTSIHASQIYSRSMLPYVACKMGGLPLRLSQQNLCGGYDIAIPAMEVTSGMAYLLTTEMTCKFEEIFSKIPIIDLIPWYLHRKHGARLRILTPSCVTAPLTYLRYSSNPDQS